MFDDLPVGDLFEGIDEPSPTVEAGGTTPDLAFGKEDAWLEGIGGVDDNDLYADVPKSRSLTSQAFQFSAVSRTEGDSTPSDNDEFVGNGGKRDCVALDTSKSELQFDWEKDLNPLDFGNGDTKINSFETNESEELFDWEKDLNPLDFENDDTKSSSLNTNKSEELCDWEKDLGPLDLDGFFDGNQLKSGFESDSDSSDSEDERMNEVAIFVSNVPPSVEEYELQEAFQRCGQVHFCLFDTSVQQLAHEFGMHSLHAGFPLYSVL